MRKYWKQCTLLCCVVALVGTAFWQIGNRKKSEIRKYSAFFFRSRTGDLMKIMR